ncbi:MAG: type II toxin-antitoxin system death-on-curing family toxin [Acidobacteria bacterium]|nr:MAG: type II toxin-antitoxin system death-on-curing family toxin [Acidobacteriota bacterium]PYY19664.1 MAG: type II toxin-antitoxin system death-on-curing family toxin [Acidobacteriota bacterium]
MTRYLSVEDILAIHEEMLARFGGIKGVRDLNALSSAVGRPPSGYYSDAIEEAAALFESLAQNHPFLDGNKRTAITATAVFLRLNSYKLVFDDVEAYESLISLYETGRVTKAAVAEWLRSHSRPEI